MSLLPSAALKLTPLTRKLNLKFRSDQTLHNFQSNPPLSILLPLPRIFIPSCSMRARFEKLIRGAQDSIVTAIEEIDGTKFRQDAWTRSSGGGGITRVLQGGNVWEKAGVAVSVVYGTMPAEAYRAAVGRAVPNLKDADRVPFFACGISSVMHPWNPHCPTMHFNYRWAALERGGWLGGVGELAGCRRPTLHFRCCCAGGATSNTTDRSSG